MVSTHRNRQAAAEQLIELLRPLAADNETIAVDGDAEEATILTTVQNLIPSLHPGTQFHTALHDGKTIYPLGGSAYAFQHDIAGPLLTSLTNDEVATTAANKDTASSSTGGALIEAPPSPDSSVQLDAIPQQTAGTALSSCLTALPIRLIVIHTGAQPNNSPHLGTLVVFCYAFLMAGTLRERLLEMSLEDISQTAVVVEMTFVDTAPVPGSTSEVDGIKYQRSHRDVPGALATYMNDYTEVLDLLSQWSGVPFRTRFRSDFFAHPAMPELVSWMTTRLPEKHGRLNEYAPERILFQCPHHGTHTINLEWPDQVAQLEANTPTPNLLRSMAHLLDDTTHHIRVTGADYAGTYQEAFLYRSLAEWSRTTGLSPGRTPHILYTPLIVDWSGAKLSKSLYLREGGYAAMKALRMDWLCSYAKLKSEYGNNGLRLIWGEVEEWFDAPHKLFRASYSVGYFKCVLRGHKWQKAWRFVSCQSNCLF